MRSILVASGMLLALAPATMAQSSSSTSSQSGTTHNQAANNAATQQQHLRASLSSALEKAGYKDIRVDATSFLIRARDSEGNPVTMTISPDMFTEIADVSKSSENTDGSSATGSVSGNLSATFVSVPQADELSSNVVGLDVYNNENKDIGQITD